MKIGSTEITDIKVGSTQITKVIRNGVTYWEVTTTTISPTTTVAPTTTAESDWTPPFESDALFWLDGAIVGTDAVDKINGWLFPITGVIDWITSKKIFPFKTLCTISAPANGTAAATAIQAKDVNNFWYALDGTANIIPFTMLFQNIDFADKCFSKHVLHTVDSNNIELTPAGIKQIVLYNSAQTANIISMVASFGAEVQATAGAKYVDYINGSDANAGTFTLPFKTIAYAITNSADNGLVYCKTGTYNETATCNISRPIKLTGIGNVIINSGHASLGIYHNANNSEITGISQTQSKATSNSTNGVKTGIIYKRCYINNPGGVGIQINSIIISDSVIKSSTTAIQKFTNATIPITINQSYICGETRGIFLIDTNINLLVLNNSTILTLSGANEVLSMRGETTITINDCVIKGYYQMVAMLATVTGAFTITNSLFEKTGTGNGPFFDTQGALLSNVTFDNCVCKSAIDKVIRFKDVLNISFINNKCISQGATANTYVWVTTLTVATVFDIHGNIITTGGTQANPPIEIGNELGEGYNLMTGIVYNNILLGGMFYDPSTLLAQHMFAVFYQNKVKVYNNYIRGGNIGIVFKTDNSVDLSLCDCHHNIVIDTCSGIVSKGGRKLAIYQNTVYNSKYYATNPSKLIILLDNGVGVDSDECIIKNNILFDNDAAHATTMVYSLEGSETGVVIDYNLIFSTNNKLSNKGDGGLAAWQALGYDVHGVNQNPLLTDVANYIMSLASGSPAIGAGADLGANYDDGLDTLTAWGGGSTLPVVITKQQGANWDIGAYVH